MGKSIILCEGETDAILISYYLLRMRKMRFFQENTFLQKTEKTYWYRNPEGETVAITWVNGHEFSPAMLEVLRVNELANSAEERFSKIAVLADHDDDSSEDMMQQLLDTLCEKARGEQQETRTYQARWEGFPFLDCGQEPYELQYFGALIPYDDEGALETFVVQQLCDAEDDGERGDNQKVRQEVNALIDRVKHSGTRYLTHRREQTKSELSLFLSVIQPDRTFSTLHEMLEDIDWKVFQNDRKGEQFRFLEDI